MKHPFKEFVYYSRGERRGIVWLIAAILLVFLIGRICRYHRLHHTVTPAQEARQAIAMAGYDSFIASMATREEETHRPRYAYGKRESGHYALHPIPFDPNTADSATLRRMGLPAWMVRNIVRYRQRGGRFHGAADFRKIYGLTEETYQALLPYIYVADEAGANAASADKGTSAGNDIFAENGTPPNNHTNQTADTLESLLLQPPAAATYKYPAGTVIDLNRADTTELKKIPGIGSAIARMITAYRARLGGFYRVEQLEEIHLDWRRLAPWFSVDPDDIRRLNVNRAGIDKLRAHPYINFYQAVRIVEERRKAGTLHNLKPLFLYDEFTPSDLERIGHYVSFE
ncbi:MAG: helix-hairpin-helix domain-containing protein [Prevotellaceae bacterium]|nr:helix-hairpin-helix domain-containing protein [Prevotellaceae bacterium]